MSPKGPRLTGNALIKALKKQGFAMSRIKGSHHFLRHEDGRTSVVPVHRGETLVERPISFFINFNCSGSTIVVPTRLAKGFVNGTAIPAPLHFLKEFI